MLDVQRATLIARGIYALGNLNADDLGAVVAYAERLSSLCLAAEPTESQEDASSDVLGGATPEASNLDGGGAE